MGIVIRTRDVNFEDSAIGFLPPVTRGLVYWNYFGSDATKCARNLAPGGKPKGAVVGAPVYASGYAKLSKTGYIQTQANQSADFTIMAVMRSAAETGAAVVSNNATPRVAPYTGNTYGASLWITNGTVGDNLNNISINQSVFDGNSATSGTITCAASLNSRQINTFRFVSGVHDSVLHQSIIRSVGEGTNATVTASAPNNIPDVGTLPFRIGYSYSDGLGIAETDVAFIAIFNAALTYSEQLEVYEFVQKYLATKGVSV